mmetsp:Transcript_47432/g.81551  ORF Transcript_47432/g.81551 Transcript_47432/m.81551 type:complete len:124 (-) Transcript_47432:1613-1984(-)
MIFDHYVRFLNPMLERVDEKIQEARPGVDIATISPEEKGIYVLRMWVAPYFQQFLIPHMNQKLEAHDQLKKYSSTDMAGFFWVFLICSVYRVTPGALYQDDRLDSSAPRLKNSKTANISFPLM